MNGVLRRYLARQILAGAALMLAALLMLFSFLDFIDSLSRVGRHGYTLTVMLKVLALREPGNLYHLLPIGVLVGALYALAQMAQQSELTVMRAAGLSARRLGVWILMAGVPFIVAAALLGEWAAPAADQQAHRLQLQATHSSYTAAIGTGMWARDGGNFINVAQVLPDATLLGVRIYQFDAGDHLVATLYAARGAWLGHHAWRLSDVRQTLFQPDRITTQHLDSLDWQSAIDPNTVRATLIDPQGMSALQLHRYIAHLAANHQKTQPYEIAFWSHLVYPFTPLVMLLLALPFSFHQSRSGSIGGKIFTGIMLGLSFHLANNVAEHLGKLNDWPPLAVALGPSACYLALACLMLAVAQRR